MIASVADTRLTATFHRSILLTVCLSSMILCAAEGRLFPAGITPLVALIAWAVVDEFRLVALPVLAANLLGLVALVAAGWEFFTGDIESKLLSGAHLIVYLVWIVLLLRKTLRQFWWVITLCLLQLAVASVLTSAAGFGASLIGMLFVLLWTLSVFSLYRVYRSTEASRSAESHTTSPPSRRPGLVGTSGIGVIDGLQRDPDQAWIAMGFRGLVFLSFLVSLGLSFIVFAAFPRVWVPGSPFASSQNEGVGQRRGIFHRTGFTETVQLGEIGKLLTSNGRVLQFLITSSVTGDAIPVESFAHDMGMDEIRFRGNAMGYYQNGQWSRGLEERGYRRGEEETPHIGLDSHGRSSDFTIEVTQDPPVSQFAFAVFPLNHVEAAKGSGRILQRTVSGSLVWSSSQSIDKDKPRSFTIECERPTGTHDLNFEHWSIPRLIGSFLRTTTRRRIRDFAGHIYITDNLQNRVPELHRISRQLVESPDGAELSTAERVARVMEFLAPENGFQYTLTLTRDNERLDPIEDFLLNTKAGHCEYFASACTLMLQSVDVPARLVNGFYGSELNSVTGKNEVKQHHSHAWVEAFVDDQWITLDPVPASDRQQVVASVKSSSLLTDLQAAFNDLWNGGIHNMTLEKQRAIFDPVLKLGASVRNNVEEKGLWEAAKTFVKDLFLNPGNWFSAQGGVVTFVLLLSGAGIYRLHPLRRLRALCRLLLVRMGRGTLTAESAVRFYVSFRKLCERNGLTFPDANTANENAAAVVAFFRPQLAADDLQRIPARIAEAFNRVRFGGNPLDDSALEQIHADLKALETALTPVTPSSDSSFHRSLST